MPSEPTAPSLPSPSRRDVRPRRKRIALHAVTLRHLRDSALRTGMNLEHYCMYALERMSAHGTQRAHSAHTERVIARNPALFAPNDTVGVVLVCEQSHGDCQRALTLFALGLAHREALLRVLESAGLEEELWLALLTL